MQEDFHERLSKSERPQPDRKVHDMHEYPQKTGGYSSASATNGLEMNIFREPQ